MSEEKKQDFEFEELLKYRELVTQNMSYSIQRIDILIIALCTSGIVLIVSSIKPDLTTSIYLIFSLLFFLLSIVVNLTSQFLGYWSNKILMEVYNEKVIDYKNDPSKYNDEDYETKSNRGYSIGKFVHRFNIGSFILFIVGAFTCLYYYSCQY